MLLHTSCWSVQIDAKVNSQVNYQSQQTREQDTP